MRFVIRNSGLSMDLSNCGLTNSTNMAQYDWLDNTCQRVRLLQVD